MVARTGGGSDDAGEDCYQFVMRFDKMSLRNFGATMSGMACLAALSAGDGE
jgi:hypothetical protein